MTKKYIEDEIIEQIKNKDTLSLDKYQGYLSRFDINHFVLNEFFSNSVLDHKYLHDEIIPKLLYINNTIIASKFIWNTMLSKDHWIFFKTHISDLIFYADTGLNDPLEAFIHLNTKNLISLNHRDIKWIMNYNEFQVRKKDIFKKLIIEGNLDWLTDENIVLFELSDDDVLKIIGSYIRTRFQQTNRYNLINTQCDLKKLCKEKLHIDVKTTSFIDEYISYTEQMMRLNIKEWLLFTSVFFKMDEYILKTFTNPNINDFIHLVKSINEHTQIKEIEFDD